MPGVAAGENIAWSYAAPLPAVARIADRIAFYNELVDITVDGVAQPRPKSIFSKAATDRPADDEPYIDRMRARPAIAAASAALVVLAAAAWWSFGDRSEESDNALTAVDDTEGRRRAGTMRARRSRG